MLGKEVSTNRCSSCHRYIVRSPNSTDMTRIVGKESFRCGSPEVTSSWACTVHDTAVCPTSTSGVGITEQETIVEIVRRSCTASRWPLSNLGASENPIDAVCGDSLHIVCGASVRHSCLCCRVVACSARSGRGRGGLTWNQWNRFISVHSAVSYRSECRGNGWSRPDGNGVFRAGAAGLVQI